MYRPRSALARPLMWPPKLPELGPLRSGLVGWWPFDQRSGKILRDRSGKRNDGTLSGCTWVPNGLSFNGTSDYVNFGNVLDMTGTQPFTVVIRTYLTEYTGEYRVLLGKTKTVSPVEGWNLFLANTSNAVGFNRIQSEVTDGFNKACTPNVWHTVIFRYDGSTMYIRIDKGTDSTKASTLSIQNHTYPLTLACYSNISLWLSASVSHILIWTRKLTDAESARICEMTQSYVMGG